MTNRIFNFGAGPAVLPTIVLEQMREYLLALPGIGMSVLEISHRSSAFDEVLATAEANIRSLASIPDDYDVVCWSGFQEQVHRYHCKLVCRTALHKEHMVVIRNTAQ